MKNPTFVFLIALGLVASIFTSDALAEELQLENGWTNAPFGTSNAEAFVTEGIVHFKGAIAGGTTGVAFTLPPALRPSTNVYVPVDLCGATKGRLVIAATGVVTVDPAVDFADAQCFTSLDGAKFALSETGFTTLTLSNGWTNAPFGTSAAAASMINGIVYLKGAIADGTTGVAFTLPAAMRPATDVYVPVDLCNAAKGRLRIQPTGVVTVSAETDFADAQCFTSLDGASFAPSTTGFTSLTLSNAWVGTPFGTGSPAVRMINGIVHLQGAMASGTTGVAFTLPIEMRPATNVYVPVDLCNATKGRLLVQPSGGVTIQAESDFADAQCFTSLDGATFITSPTGFTELTLSNAWVGSPFATSAPQIAMFDGIVYFKGAIASGATPVAFTLPPTMRPATAVYVPVDMCSAAPGRLVIQPSGVVTVDPAVDFADAECFTSLDGASFAPSATGFTPLALSNGWTDEPFGTSDAAASRINGIVHLKGAIAGGTTGVAFTLPIEMRPETNVYVPVDLCDAAPGRLFIQSSGVVTVDAAVDFADAQCFTSLDGAKFAPSAAGFANLSLTNGWTTSPFSTSTAAASILRNIVHMKGAITGGANDVIFTLPSLLRPEANTYVRVDLCNAEKGRLFIQPDGEVRIQADNDFSEAQCFTSLDGAIFAVPEPAVLPALVSGLLLLVWLRGVNVRGLDLPSGHPRDSRDLGRRRAHPR